jgi:hypothetical protein
MRGCFPRTCRLIVHEQYRHDHEQHQAREAGVARLPAVAGGEPQQRAAAHHHAELVPDDLDAVPEPAPLRLQGTDRIPVGSDVLRRGHEIHAEKYREEQRQRVDPCCEVTRRDEQHQPHRHAIQHQQPPLARAIAVNEWRPRELERPRQRERARETDDR